MLIGVYLWHGIFLIPIAYWQYWCTKQVMASNILTWYCLYICNVLFPRAYWIDSWPKPKDQISARYYYCTAVIVKLLNGLGLDSGPLANCFKHIAASAALIRPLSVDQISAGAAGCIKHERWGWDISSYSHNQSSILKSRASADSVWSDLKWAL